MLQLKGFFIWSLARPFRSFTSCGESFVPIPDVQLIVVGFALGAAEDFVDSLVLPACIQTEDFPTLAHT